MSGNIPESRSAYGAELKHWRERAGLTQEALSQRVIMSRTHIAHIEAGRRKPSLEDAKRLDQILETGGVLERFLPLLEYKEIADHYAAAMEFEQQATMIREYGALLIPGLFQTEEYAHAVLKCGYPPMSKERREAAVRTRIGRSRVFIGSDVPMVWALLDEAALRRPVGGRRVMAQQLRHILELGESENVRVHVLPFGVGAHSLLDSGVTLMWFDDAPPVAYVEGLNTGKVLDLPRAVQQCQAAYDLALGDALSQEKSLDLISAFVEEYEHEQESV